MILGWVIGGFRLVTALGAPEKIKEARKYLWYVFLFTGILFLIQAVVLAVKSYVGA
jgi:hypothetical protein